MYRLCTGYVQVMYRLCTGYMSLVGMLRHLFVKYYHLFNADKYFIYQVTTLFFQDKSIYVTPSELDQVSILLVLWAVYSRHTAAWICRCQV